MDSETQSGRKRRQSTRELTVAAHFIDSVSLLSDALSTAYVYISAASDPS